MNWKLLLIVVGFIVGGASYCFFIWALLKISKKEAPKPNKNS